MSLKARETDQLDSTYKRIEINIYIYICIPRVHVSQTMNKMRVNIESQNDGRGSIDRIAFREDSSVQKRIFLFRIFPLFFPLLPIFATIVYRGFCSYKALRWFAYRDPIVRCFVLFGKLMDDVIYSRLFFCFVISTIRSSNLSINDAYELTGYKLQNV